MSDSAIEWTDKTWNPVTGCSKVSEGCRNCYAEAISLRFKRSVGPWNAVNAPQNVILHPERLAAPLGWKKPAKIFVNSMSDLFHELVDEKFVAKVFAVMALTPRHTYQVLTKRPERMQRLLTDEDFVFHVGWFQGQVNRELKLGLDLDRLPTMTPGGVYTGLPNVWLGTSVEDQRAADERIPHLLRTPAAVRFLSCEPLLGPVDLTRWFPSYSVHGSPVMAVETQEALGRLAQAVWAAYGGPRIDWVIVGGESGPGHREMQMPWLVNLVHQCRDAGVPVFVKQDSGAHPGRQGHIHDNFWLKQFPAPARHPAATGATP